MGSGYFGEPNLQGNEGSGGGGGTSSSSRRSKKSNSEKPKQPQRGLGVAQLEKIRLHSQMGGSNYIPSLHNPYNSPNLTLQEADMRLHQAPYSSSASSFSCSTPSSSTYGFPGQQSIEMGMNDFERGNFRYADSQPAATTRWTPAGNPFLDTQQFNQPNMTRQLLDLQVEDSLEKRRRREHGKSDSIGSSSHNSESSGNQELDLELRLSL